MRLFLFLKGKKKKKKYTVLILLDIPCETEQMKQSLFRSSAQAAQNFPELIFQNECIFQ